MKNLTVLHLSDLHLSDPVVWDQTLLIEALIEDIEKTRYSREAPDLVVFSGDLAFAGGSASSYDKVMDLMLKILDTVGLDENKLLLCAGNHDVDRSVVGKNLPSFEKFRNAIKSPRGANEIVDDKYFREYVKESISNFLEFSSAFSSAACIYQDELCACYFFRDLGISVVTLNTATLSSGGLSDHYPDLGALFVSEKVLVTAISKLPKGVGVIVVGHHPSSWLQEGNQTVFDRVLSSQAIAYLCGHLHDALPRQSKFMNGELLQAQSGALYCGRDYWNGYAYLTFDPDRKFVRASYRRWFEQRRSFSKAEDLGDDGIFYSSREAQDYWIAVTPKIDSAVLDHWRLAKLVPYLISRFKDTFQGQDFDAYFVPPDFDREIPYRTEAEGRVGSRLESLEIADLIKNSVNYVVSARPETGKSTLLKKIALSLAKTTNVGSGVGIPVLLQFSAIRAYSKYIENLIRGELPDLPKEIGINELLEQGLLIILVDDVDFVDAKRRKSLTEFVSQYPKCRYILASSTTFVEMAALQPEIVPDVPFTRVRMKPFRKVELQALVQNHGLTDPLQVDQMVERVIRDASALNVPLTAVTGTFLIQIIREEPDSTVINQAALIERYIEMSLQKYAPKELLPGAFDFKNKVDLLCNIFPKL